MVTVDIFRFSFLHLKKFRDIVLLWSYQPIPTTRCGLDNRDIAVAVEAESGRKR
jgi:hypothetical protein